MTGIATVSKQVEKTSLVLSRSRVKDTQFHASIVILSIQSILMNSALAPKIIGFFAELR